MFTALLERALPELSEQELLSAIRQGLDLDHAVDALWELAKRRAAVRGELLESLLADSRQHPSLRLAAANILGTEALPAYQAILLRAAPNALGNVLNRVLQSLGRIGDETALHSLDSIITGEDRSVRALRFARTLIAYRLRLNTHRLDPPPGDLVMQIDPRTADECKTRPLTEDEFRQAADTSRSELPAILLSTTVGVSIQCPGTELALIAARGFETVQQFETLKEASAAPFVLLEKSSCPDGYALSEYFFAHPAADAGAAKVFGVSPHGGVSYFGVIDHNSGGAGFSIRAIDSGYTPAVEIEGAFGPDTKQFVFRAFRSETKLRRDRRRRRTPERDG
ncbi:MAG: HEAT repeat domain-containing protein [Bryobacteraceae bacterium]